MLRRRSIGADGAESEFCDLSGRGLTTSQVERTLRVFDSAIAIDMSNNELDEIPTTIPKDVIALDISFNLLANAYNIELLKQLREVHLGFNRLVDVSILEYCPLLQRVNVSGNRLLNTKGLETLVYLENLDLSDNLIEFPDALRALSLNQQLTHLRLRGNPITTKIDARLVVMEMMPSVLLLDEKKIRTTSKSSKSIESSTTKQTKSLSYARIYNDKKHFMIHTQSTRLPANHRPPPILVGCDPSANNGPYTGSTMFLQTSPTKSVARVANTDRLIRRASLNDKSPRRGEGLTSPGRQPACRLTSPTTSQPYMSMYDRLAHANGINVATTKPQTDPVTALAATATTTDRRQSTMSRKSIAPLRRESAVFKPSAGATAAPPPSRRQSTMETPSVAPAGTQPPPPPTTTTRPVTPVQPAVGVQSRPYSPAYQPQPLSQTVQSHHTMARQSTLPQPLQPHQVYNPQPMQQYTEQQLYTEQQQYTEQPLSLYQSLPSQQATFVPSMRSASQSRSSISSGPNPHPLDPKQQNVLSVIQNLIQHKKQTLATLAPNAVYS